MYAEPPPYGTDVYQMYPKTTQPQTAWTGKYPHPGGAMVNPHPGGAIVNGPTAPPLTAGLGPASANMSNPGGGGGGGGSNNISNSGNGSINNGGINNVSNNTNNNTNANTSNVVVNANVNAVAGGGAGGAGGNHLCLITKDRLQGRNWNSGLCSCLNDFVGCFFGFVCLPLVLARLANRLDECAFLPCCVPGGVTALRTKLRTMGGIRGSICRDCLVTHFCCCCSACQMAREMDAMHI